MVARRLPRPVRGSAFARDALLSLIFFPELSSVGDVGDDWGDGDSWTGRYREYRCLEQIVSTLGSKFKRLSRGVLTHWLML